MKVTIEIIDVGNPNEGTVMIKSTPPLKTLSRMYNDAKAGKGVNCGASYGYALLVLSQIHQLQNPKAKSKIITPGDQAWGDGLIKRPGFGGDNGRRPGPGL